ncbi:MAG: AMP-binding protein [Pirellulaceae bacterium]
MMKKPTEIPDLLDTLLSQAMANGELCAVDDGKAAVTYEQLIALAKNIARTIFSKSKKPCPKVLVALSSSTSAFASMIASMMSGGTFCPVDITGVPERNRTICRLFDPDVIVHDGVTPAFLDAIPVTTRLLDLSRLPSDCGQVEVVNEHNDVAYVVFTSGSTGVPKGVKVGRMEFSYFVDVAQRYFNVIAGERWGQWTNLGHDLAVMDVFMALVHGATLVPLSPAERIRPAMAIKNRYIAIWQSVPSVLEMMLRANQLSADFLSTLRVISFCGEPLHRHHLDALFEACPKLEVFNTYGATETIGFNTLNRLTSTNYANSCEAGSVAIGDDVPGWSLFLRGGLNDDEGEIVMASDYLSLGYWQDEERTRAAFRQVDVGDSKEARCYFTGDRGVRKNSLIYCLGRTDRQVKILGERIELDEIDFVLRDAGFRGAYTLFRDGELYSFVETADTIDEERIRKLLLASLPFHAVPKSIRALPLLPRNQNGKIDRAAIEREIQP